MTKKAECKECKKLQELLNKRYYEDLERSKSYRELNSKYVELQKENEELRYKLADKVNTIMFLCWMLVKEWVHTKSYGTTLKHILENFNIVIETAENRWEKLDL